MIEVGKIFFLIFYFVILGHKAYSADKIDKKTYEEILRTYTFVGDFHRKPSLRKISEREVFWRYPIVIPEVTFRYLSDLEKKTPVDEWIPVTKGIDENNQIESRAISHMNRGRVLFINGEYQKARNTWLAGIQNFGKKNPYHRRLDYFVALAFEKLVRLKTNELSIKTGYNNAAAYLSWTYQVKKDIPDPILDDRTPYHMYNLAAIYYNFKRYGGAFSIASEALDWLRKNGRKDYRPKLTRILAEAFVRNRTYLRAVQEYDIALREDHLERLDAASIFARVGDLYFDLNNFELAEDTYKMAIQIDREDNIVRPSQYMLRGESLFWLGRFSEAQKMFHYALAASGRPLDDTSESKMTRVDHLSDKLAAVASIRTADAWLVQVDMDRIAATKSKYINLERRYKRSPRGSSQKVALKKSLSVAKLENKKALKPLEKAKIGYSRHIREFPMDHTSDHARIRLACLELPIYQGENIRHARELLKSLREGRRANELAITPDVPEIEKKEEKPSTQSTAEEQEKNTGAKEEPEPDADEEVTQPEEPIPALPQEAVHMAWGCETASFAQHQRNQDMVERVREFTKSYPRSSFIKRLIEPVRETQAKKLQEFIDKGDIYSAAIFFESTRDLLFKTISKKTARQLFEIYVDIYASEKAEEFYQYYQKTSLSSEQRLRLAVFASETVSLGAYANERSKNISANFAKDKLSLKNSPRIRLYLDRVINSPKASDHYSWILDLADRWTEDDSKIACELTYPLLSKIWQRGSASNISKNDIKNRLSRLMSRNLVELVQFETYCGYSLLEFESKVFADRPLELYEKLMGRDFLPINSVTGNILWMVSENLSNNGHLLEAENIWKKLRDSGEDSVKEVVFAKIRLDKSKTELESLWQ